jgi:hypothetical protein
VATLAEIPGLWYRWHRAPDDVKAAVLAFIEQRKFRISSKPAPILYVHPIDKTVETILGQVLTRFLEKHYPSPLFVPFENQMIAVWCRSLEVELKDA